MIPNLASLVFRKNVAWPLLLLWIAFATPALGQFTPFFTVQPKPGRVAPGGTISLSATAVGDDVRYQWYRGTTPLEGAVAPELIITNAQRTDTAGYWVVASNGVGSASSQRAGWIVTDLPSGEIWWPNQSRILRRDTGTLKFLPSPAVVEDYKQITGYAIGPDGAVFVTSTRDDSLLRFDPLSGKLTGTLAMPPETSPVHTTAFIWGLDGNAYFSDWNKSGTHSLNGTTLAHQGALERFSNARDLRIARDGTILATSFGDSIRLYRAGDGRLLRSTPPAREKGLVRIVAFDIGDDGTIYCADGSTNGGIHRLRMSDGAHLSVLLPGGTGGLRTPIALAVGKDQILYVADDQQLFRFHAGTGEFLDSDYISVAPPLRYITPATPAIPKIVLQPEGGNFPGLNEIKLSAHLETLMPLEYQWLKNGLPLVGSNSHPMHLAGSHRGTDGDYQVVVRNGLGSVTSSVARVTVFPGRPEILGPERWTATNGSPFQIGPSEILGEAPFSYQWGRSLFSGNDPIAGATNASIGFDPILGRQAGWYSLTVSNRHGISIHKSYVSVPPSGKLRILAQPRQLAVLSGAPMDVPLLLDGRPPFTNRWSLDGVLLTNQLLAAPQLPLLPHGTLRTLVCIVSNQTGHIISEPIQLRFVGTNFHREVQRPFPVNGQGFGSQTIPFPFKNLPEQRPLIFGLDLRAVSSWDGGNRTYGPDVWTVWKDGQAMFQTTFCNNDDSTQLSYFLQGYPGTAESALFDPRLGSIGIDPRVDPKDFDTYDRVRTMTVYRHRFQIATETNKLALAISADGLTDETWAYDNVYLSVPPSDASWIRIVDKAIRRKESDGIAEIQVERRGNLDQTVSVRYATIDAAAVSEIDYVGGQGSLTFEKGETLKTVRIPIIDNSRPDPIRSFGVWLLDAGFDALFLETPFAGVAIVDDESGIRWKVLQDQISPGTSALTATVERFGDLTLPVSVPITRTAVGRPDSIQFPWSETNVLWLHMDSGESSLEAWRSSLAFNQIRVFAATVREDAPVDGSVSATLSILSRPDFNISGSNSFTVKVTSPLPKESRISEASVFGDGTFRLKTEFASGIRAVIEVSGDLRTWIPVREISDPGEVAIPMNPESSAFFRLRVGP